jgi:hypothetical protein
MFIATITQRGIFIISISKGNFVAKPDCAIANK